LLQLPSARGYPEKTMVFAEIQPEFQNARYFRGAMDARTVACLVGVKLGTLNSWVQRGLIPGMAIGTKGRPRNIDADTALRISVFAELMRAGTAIDYAANIVKNMPQAVTQAGWMYIPGPGMEHYDDPTARIIVSYSPSVYVLAEHIRRTENQAPDPPVSFTALNLGKLAARVRQAEEEWQSRGSKS
jgi:hypothetical protein